MKTNSILVTAFILLAGLSSCNSAKTEDSKTENTEVSSPGKIKDVKLAAAYTNYLDLKNALVSTDAAKAKTEASSLQASLKEISGSDAAQQHAAQISATDD